jgi:hypothetical protein
MDCSGMLAATTFVNWALNRDKCSVSSATARRYTTSDEKPRKTRDAANVCVLVILTYLQVKIFISASFQHYLLLVNQYDF